MFVIDDLDVVVDGRRPQLEEEAGKGRAAWATVEPKDDRVLLGVIARLEEPCVKELAHTARY